MVSIVWATIALSLGFLTFALPPLLAPLFGPASQRTLGDKYGWLAVQAFGRPRLRRKLLGGYTITTASYDSEKQADELDVGEKGHIKDYDNRLGRLYSKTFGGAYDGTTMVLDAELSELGWWHHYDADENALEVDGEMRVDPYFHVPKQWRLSDLRHAMYLMAGDAEPDHPNTVEDFTDMALSQYRSSVGVTEMMSGLLGFLASFGAIIFAQQYVLDGSAGGGVPTSPIPLGQLTLADLVVMLG